MFDLGEREGLGGGGGHRVGVAGIQQALEHHPAVVDVAVDRQVDPAEAAVRDTALHFVLPADQVAARKLGNERVPCAALGAEALRTAGLAVLCLARRACRIRGCRRTGFPSGTCGSVRIAVAGSPLGIVGTG